MKSNCIFKIIQRLIIGIILIQINADIKSQDYIPLAVEGAQWIIRYDDIITPPTVDGLWEYYATGDTCIGNECYKKVFKRLLVPTDELPPFEPDGEYELYGFIRDDSLNHKVYAIQFNEFGNCPANEDFLLFDFSLDIGDTAEFCLIPSFMDYVISSITPGAYLGFDTRIFSNNLESDYYEGMGSFFGLFEEMFAPIKSREEKYIYHYFLYYYCHESPCGLIVSLPENYTPDVFFQISPNPTTKILHIRINSPLIGEAILLHNMHGQEIKKIYINSGMQDYKLEIDNLTPGLYIATLIDGKQIIDKKKVIITN